jgi:type II secretory ATPase GspE/PulE/Tfp pilus assembly ATPase PilB-like protein
MKPEILAWLVKEDGIVLPPAVASQPVPRVIKQALVARVCGKCKKEIRGNVYFAHIRGCRAA